MTPADRKEPDTMTSSNPWKDIYNATQKEIWDEAIQTIDSLIKKEPTEPQYFINLGDLYVNEGNIHDALTAYREAINLYRKANFDSKAILVYKKILAIDPKNPEALKELNEISTRQQRKKDTVHIKLKLGKDRRLITEKGDLKQKLEIVLKGRRSPDFLLDMMDDETLDGLRSLKTVTCEEGKEIIREGERGDSIYIILKGHAQVSTAVESQKIVLSELGEGDIFGEMGFLTSKPRFATVTALTDAEVLELNRDFLGRMFARRPYLMKYLYDMYTSRMDVTISNLKKSGDSFSGSLAEVSLPDILQFFEQTGKSGTLHISTDDRSGSVSCRDNMIMDAVFGTMKGEDALVELLMLTAGRFRFQSGDVHVGELAIPVRFALMETFRLVDEKNLFADYIPRSGEKFSLLSEPSEEDMDVKAVVEAVKGGAGTIEEVRKTCGRSRIRADVATAKLIKQGIIQKSGA